MPLDASYVGTTEEKTEVKVKIDPIYLSLIEKTPEEIEAFFTSKLSALSGLTDEQIEVYIDTNVNSLGQAKAALATLAKDTAFTIRVEKLLSKALILLAQKTP